MNRSFIRRLICVFSGLLFCLCVYGQNTTYILGYFDYNSAEVKVRGGQWRKLTLDDSKKLVLSLSDSLKVEKGSVSIFVKSSPQSKLKKFIFGEKDQLKLAGKGKWSVRQVVEGKAARSIAHSPTGDSSKSLDRQDAVSLDILSTSGLVKHVFEIGENIFAVVANSSGVPIYVSIWWREKDDRIAPFLSPEEGLRLESGTVSILPQDGPLEIGEPEGPVDVYLVYSDKPFVNPVLPSDVDKEAFERLVTKDGQKAITQHIRVVAR